MNRAACRLLGVVRELRRERCSQPNHRLLELGLVDQIDILPLVKVRPIIPVVIVQFHRNSLSPNRPVRTSST